MYLKFKSIILCIQKLYFIIIITNTMATATTTTTKYSNSKIYIFKYNKNYYKSINYNILSIS